MDTGANAMGEMSRMSDEFSRVNDVRFNHALSLAKTDFPDVGIAGAKIFSGPRAGEQFEAMLAPYGGGPLGNLNQITIPPFNATRIEPFIFKGGLSPELFAPVGPLPMPPPTLYLPTNEGGVLRIPY